MQFKEYQDAASATALYPKDTAYPFLGLCGEAGEVAEKMKKILRDKGGVVGEEEKADLTKELGDVLWYVAAICNDYGISMNDVAQGNIDKLMSRKERGKLQGSGDNR